MKYVIDIDALNDCLDCLEMIKINGELYVSTKLAKEFIKRFPKDPLEDLTRETTVVFPETTIK